jgi:hypothetical protein
VVPERHGQLTAAVCREDARPPLFSERNWHGHDLSLHG